MINPAMLLQVAPHWHPDFIHRHPYCLPVAVWLISAAAGALPAPTKTSSTFYQWFFPFANTVAANISRALNTSVEKSPNWQDAVNLHSQAQQEQNKS